MILLLHNWIHSQISPFTFVVEENKLEFSILRWSKHFSCNLIISALAHSHSFKVSTSFSFLPLHDIMMLWSECLYTPKIHMLKPNPQCDGTRRWALWKVIRSWGQSPCNRDPTGFPSSYPYMRRKLEICNLISGFQPPRLWEILFCCLLATWSVIFC